MSIGRDWSLDIPSEPPSCAMGKITELPDDFQDSPLRDDTSKPDASLVHDSLNEESNGARPAMSGPSKAEVETKTFDELIQDFQRTPFFMTDLGSATDAGMRNFILASRALHDH